MSAPCANHSNILLRRQSFILVLALSKITALSTHNAHSELRLLGSSISQRWEIVVAEGH